MSDLEVSVVIPVYNEDEIIKDTIKSLKKNIPVPFECIVVYDLDEDTTLPHLKDIQEDVPELRYIKNNVCRGPSGALRTGFAEAKASRILVAMGDSCDDHSQIPHFLDLIPSETDLVCPSRYCTGGEQQLEASIKVWLPNTAGCLLKWLTGIPTLDPTNSFKMYSAELIRSLELKSTVSFSVTLEIVVKAHLAGFRIKEIPTVWKDRTSGESKFQIGPSIPAYLKWFLKCVIQNPFRKRSR